MKISKVDGYEDKKVVPISIADDECTLFEPGIQLILLVIWAELWNLADPYPTGFVSHTRWSFRKSSSNSIWHSIIQSAVCWRILCNRSFSSSVTPNCLANFPLVSLDCPHTPPEPSGVSPHRRSGCKNSLLLCFVLIGNSLSANSQSQGFDGHFYKLSRI
ncbi:hypothetical protein L1987_74496 [Smallanthus sonchifolius]|uniref:Uncharacterized protein n=1 Tax=Smallanthus sonchifolius TaxID=185202 RepID=A0ACB9A3V7_9ASTR|nr:hypothetical protein L1987_74496 [Smallanthus sonchifolius]